MPGKNGFTMVEMLLVLSIIIVLSAITSSYVVVNRPKISLNQQCLVIVSLLEEAKTQAILNHCQVDIEITHQMINYQYRDQSRSVSLDASYYFESSDNFHFNRNGNINLGGTLKISDGNNSSQIVLNVGSGAFYVR
ncbi:competence type IV pilus minor pilin ComGD [uncultured Thomasclavelia sp.]|uniref:competence type IV pilus minor pilin ComGD n=1 Tax=uncultured Thomasclavelia sp. TaxID=3025759 RepID=UPI0025D423D4|nr:competence type IV pilus minor pilin ComGD [uncultured Thomasclavelia sp.]